MREPGSITGRRESFADHRRPFMEFDCGDKKRLVFMMQRGKNWSRDGLKKKEKKNKKNLTCVLRHYFTFLLSVSRLGNGVVSHLIDVALIIVIKKCFVNCLE